MTEEIVRRLRVLLADDDEDDRLLTSEAFSESRLNGELRCVADGEEAMQYLQRRGTYENADVESAPRPDIILLDLNMPRKDGREVLRELKNDEALRGIPVIVLTTSKAEEDILRTYNLGVNSFITKPITFDGLVDVMKMLDNYWSKTVRLPQRDE